jgi:hypothetical protein
VGFHPGRPRLHAQGQRLPHDLLDHHDPVSIVTGWVSSVTYVAALSLWALVSGHWSAWQAARVEVEQRKEAEERERQDHAQDVVDRMVEETDVQPASGGRPSESDA